MIEFDELGLMKSISRSERNIAHRLIEEFMLSANESVAAYLENKRVASLYRIHEKPDAKRVYDFEVIAATFGYSLGVGALPIERMQMKSDRRERRGTGKRAQTIEIPKEVHITPRMYQKLTEKIAGKPEEQILSYLMLRSLRQARYSETNEGHFALAATSYTHFTSPIRRYPDLIVHRILKSVLQQTPERHDGEVAVGVFPFTNSGPRAGRHSGSDVSPWSKRREKQKQSQEDLWGPIPLEVLHEIAEESSQAERRAEEAERELMEWKKAKFMEQHIGDEFDGLIISVTKFGFFVELNDLFVEGLVPLSSLTDDRYFFHENSREIIGQHARKSYRLGQKIRVMVERIDPVEKKIRLPCCRQKSRSRESIKYPKGLTGVGENGSFNAARLFPPTRSLCTGRHSLVAPRLPRRAALHHYPSAHDSRRHLTQLPLVPHPQQAAADHNQSQTQTQPYSQRTPTQLEGEHKS